MDNTTPTPHNTSPAEGTEKPSILYIDDEEDNLVVFKSTFRKFFKVFTAMSGDEGLKILASEPISIVIIDQRMPKMSGVHFLKSLPDDPEIIRMILTGYSDPESMLEAINSGKVYRYIMKPWDRENLRRIMENAIIELNTRKANRQLVEELKAAKESLERKVAELTKEANQNFETEDAPQEDTQKQNR
ncbi:response regulator [Rufibacter tibetensis]|uniref:response regulator n=1 Tax=Rufibacter tibetensis TaxID=512763 RepID=UPI00090068DE|nr:response regulator [Rufibacter tibetensis]